MKRVWPLLLAVALPSSAQQPARLAITNVDVLTMEDGARYRRGQTVLIEGDVIRDVGVNLPVPADARRIDGSGLTMVPGLMDMHVHLEGDPATWIGAFLAHGVTTVLNLRGGPPQLELRARVNRGELLAPRVFTSGPYVNRPAIETEQDAARAAREQKAAGYDVLKIHGPLGHLAYRTLLDTARALGLAVVGHAPRNLSFDSVIALRQPMLAHAEEMIYTKFTALDSTQLGNIPARMAAARIWLTPTLSTFHGIAAQWGRPAAADSALKLSDAGFFSDELKRYWTQGNPYTGRPADGAAWALRAYNFQRPLIRTLQNAGVRLLAGTDTPLPVMIPGASLHLELAELQGAGLSAYDVLAAATRNPGDFLAEQVDARLKIGRIAKDYRADVLLLRGDPLNSLSVLSTPQAVITRGRYLDGEKLKALRTRAR